MTKKLITEIIQESTEAIYEFEDTAISCADLFLKNVLHSEVNSVVKECLKSEFVKKYQKQEIID